jgi:phosphate transport system substrate-binding protein
MSSRRQVLLRLAALCGPGAALAQDASYALMPAPPPRPIPGTLRIAGTRAIEPLLLDWLRALTRQQPQLRTQVSMRGSDVGMAGLYTGTADLALIGRDSTPAEDKAFEWIYRYRLSRVEIATGSLDQPGMSPAPVFFVHPDNPIRVLTIEQVRGLLLAADENADSKIRRWGDLGLAGEWASADIRVYCMDMESGTGRFVRQQVLGGGRHLAWARMTEFPADPPVSDEKLARRIFRALDSDRRGMALIHHIPGQTAQPLAIVPDDTPAPVAATHGSLSKRAYPLARPVYAYFNQAPGAARSPEISALIDYIRSEAGQGVVRSRTGYLPLPMYAVQS